MDEHALQYYVGCSGWSYTSYQDPFYHSNIENSGWLNCYLYANRDITMFSYSPPPIISVEEFFHDDPNNTPWKPLPEHDLKQSPCYPIMDI